jgi:hypothetical protein
MCYTYNPRPGAAGHLSMETVDYDDMPRDDKEAESEYEDVDAKDSEHRTRCLSRPVLFATNMASYPH